jgi:hypothetical protein
VAEVFAYICEVEHGRNYISGQREAHKTSTGPMGIGTTFTTSSKLPRRAATFEITEYERDRCLACKAMSGARRRLGASSRLVPALESHSRKSPTQMASFDCRSRCYRCSRRSARVDHELAALKKLLAVTRKPADKSW